MGRQFAVYAKKFYPDLEQVWLIGRDMKRLTKVSCRLPVSSKIFATDITKKEERYVIKKTLEEEQPEIQLLVNSAGMGIIGNFEEMSEEDCTDMLQVNCEALTVMTKMCLPYMTEGSHIINLASAAAFVPQPGFAVYAASKSYVYSLSYALSKELKKRKISVTAVCPGCVDTPFFHTAEKYSKLKTYKRFFMAKEKDVVKKALWDAKKKKPSSVYGFWINGFYVLCKFLPIKFLLFFM